MMWWNDGTWGAGDWFAMSFMMLVFWSLMTALVVWLVRSRGRSGQDSTSRQAAPVAPGADEVLDERFARGEIDADEHARQRALLHNSTSRS